MKIEISAAEGKGTLKEERLILRVTAATDIGDYILVQAGFGDGEVKISTYHTYWFPYQNVMEGDLIVLYTKSGKWSTRKLERGGTAYFYYWGLGKAIWQKKDRTPVLLHAPDWIHKEPDAL